MRLSIFINSFFAPRPISRVLPSLSQKGGIEHFIGFSFHFLIYPFLADTTSRYICLAYCLKYCCKWDFFPWLFGDVINSDILACSNSLHKLAQNMCRVGAWRDVLVYFFFFLSFRLFSTAQILAENFIMNHRLNFENKKCRLDSLQTTDIPLKLRLRDGLLS